MSKTNLADTNDSSGNANSHTESESVSVGNGERNSYGTERDASFQEKEILTISTMPSVIPSNSPIPPRSDQPIVHSEPVFKIEPGTETLPLAIAQNNDSGGHHFSQDTCNPIIHEGFIGEEPLEIQCGENSALLYISKLCQGSKGPCILFNNEWLTPNELQYISGRETAKDWKRSIRYKGKSLKSLIARGLIKVHPPICDCLGCRISSPVNRGRLASKCGVAPPSPRSRKRDVSKSLSCWSHEELEGATPHRHYSTSDLDGFSRHTAVNGLAFKESRDSSSSATSECSEGQDENPFSPVTKRPRSNSPELTFEDRAKLPHKRRASDSSIAFIQKAGESIHYDRSGLSMHRVVHLNELKDSNPEENQENKADSLNSEESRASAAKARSAFRTVNQDAVTSMTLADATEGIQREMAIRAAKIKQKPQSQGGAPTQFLPPQYTNGPGIVSPTHTSPRLVPDPLLFTNPHGTNIYHHAFRGAGYHGVPPLSRNLMQYRLLSPPGTGNSPQNPLAGLSLQNQLIMQDLAVMSAVGGKGHLIEKKQNSPEENGISHKRRRSSNDYSDNERTNNASAFSDDERSSPRKENEQSNHDRTNYVSVIHKSPAHSPLTVESAERKSSYSSKTHNDILRQIRPHRLIPKLRLHLDDDIIHWSVDQVAEFISSLTGSPEIVLEFKEQCIDGQSLILLKEEHLLNRLGIKLGPALKILAHIEKILEKLSRDETPPDSCDSS
ncbi:uncharacterized protein LOC116306534 [Actinia tenebrosa]|uniref:Uncharacterized protein LOC116306534 n=1 Tax=Actinia tenebrosa TaxID=6105 RepID=A0A6P8J4Q2_ACTTE|nr:uncharacterized protein LOC116306534 [Actinia tenebrosa]